MPSFCDEHPDCIPAEVVVTYPLLVIGPLLIVVEIAIAAARWRRARRRPDDPT